MLEELLPGPTCSAPMDVRSSACNGGIDVNDAQSAAQATDHASRAGGAIYGCPWNLNADSIEVIGPYV